MRVSLDGTGSSVRLSVTSRLLEASLLELGNMHRVVLPGLTSDVLPDHLVMVRHRLDVQAVIVELQDTLDQAAMGVLELAADVR
jgi:hypothetical protein